MRLPMMKSIFSLLALALLAVVAFPSNLGAQQKSDTDTKIKAMEQKWTDAYRLADVASMTKFLDDDVIVTVEDGATFSKSGYIAHSVEAKGNVEVAEISEVKVRMHGSTAVVTGAYHEKGKSKGKPYELRDRFTDIWQNQGGGNWTLIASHYSIPVK
jgi:ketosteroid isomerase-like protein